MNCHSNSLDPQNWDILRSQAHKMVDDIFDHLISLRARPLWTQMSSDCIQSFEQNSPAMPSSIGDVYDIFTQQVVPYHSGNIHPGFCGWAQGGGNPVGMMAEMLSAGINMNCGGRNHVGIKLEKQVVEWVKEWFDFPNEADGIFVTGSSQANFMGILTAKTNLLSTSVRHNGIQVNTPQCIVYTSAAAHGCIKRAMEMSGFGSVCLRCVPVDPVTHQIDLKLLQSEINATKQRSDHVPMMVIGTAGTVDTGAIDDLQAIGTICRKENVWFHVDGAFGAVAVLSKEYKHLLAGIETADSIAFDFHKWANVPYDSGFFLVRDGAKLKQTFAQNLNYLKRDDRGLSGGDHWPCDYGPDLSRGCKALKTWFTIKTYGTDALGGVVTKNCQLAQYLAALVAKHSPKLELLAPVALNIVCFRYVPSIGTSNISAEVEAVDGLSIAEDTIDEVIGQNSASTTATGTDRVTDCASVQHNIDSINNEIVLSLYEQGLVAPSVTKINSVTAIRACLINHRIQTIDMDNLINNVLLFGKKYDI